MRPSSAGVVSRRRRVRLPAATGLAGGATGKPLSLPLPLTLREGSEVGAGAVAPFPFVVGTSDGGVVGALGRLGLDCSAAGMWASSVTAESSAGGLGALPFIWAGVVSAAGGAV